jgi:hypothetical protein
LSKGIYYQSWWDNFSESPVWKFTKKFRERLLRGDADIKFLETGESVIPCHFVIKVEKRHEDLIMTISLDDRKRKRIAKSMRVENRYGGEIIANIEGYLKVELD